MEALKVISTSWPIAIMFIAFLAAAVGFYIIRSIRQTAQEDRAVRASTAVVVKQREDY